MLLFTRVPIGGVAWLRIVSAALVFAVWRRPWRAFVATDRRTRWLIAALGAVFAVMNYSFYVSIDRLPLGTVAAIEFVGPIILALVGARSWRNLAALGLAVTGIYLLTDLRIAGDSMGFAWAFANAALFTLYIVVGHRISRSELSPFSSDAASSRSSVPVTSAIDRLGAATVIASILISPLGLGGAIPAMTDLSALGAGIGVGISSSVIPYALDQLAMTRLARSTYAVFVALLPATAVVIGVLVLRQIPASIEVAGVGLVIAGVLMHEEGASGEVGNRAAGGGSLQPTPRPGARDLDQSVDAVQRLSR